MERMTKRELLGAIPIIGSVIGAITLIKNKERTSTDQKINQLVVNNPNDAQEPLLPNQIALAPLENKLETVYQKRLQLLEEAAIDKRNAKHELIPLWGTLHHLFWRFIPLPHNNGLHSLRDQPAVIRAQAAIDSLSEVGKLDEAKQVKAALEQLKADPKNEDKILQLFTCIRRYINEPPD